MIDDSTYNRGKKTEINFHDYYLQTRRGIGRHSRHFPISLLQG